jgi:hypothetical protein
MEKNIIFLFIVIFLLSCKSNNYKNIEIYRDNRKLNLLIYKDEDSSEIIIPFAYKITNNSNKILNLNPIKPKRKVTFLTEQHFINENNELQTFFLKKIKSKESLTVIVFGSKIINNDDLEYPLVKEKSLAEYKKLINIEDYQDIKFKKTDLYKNLVNEIEKDSIFFHFTNREENIDFYKVGTIEGKTFFTDDKSNK